MKDEGASRPQQHAVDWEAVRQRLDKARATAEQGGTLSPEQKENVLRDRAKALAIEAAPVDSGEQIEVVEFLLAYEQYGLESSLVREVYPLKDLTPVPCTPAHVLGIINVRGRILSIVDLKKFFDLPEKGLGDFNKVIIVNHGGREFGILADVIVGVRTLPKDSLQQALPTLTGIREEYLKGIAPDRTIILDGKKILADTKLVVNEEVNV